MIYGLTVKLLPIIFVIGLGFALKRIKFFHETQWQGLDKLCYNVLMPALIGKIILVQDVRWLLTATTAWIALLAIMIVIIIFSLLFKPMKRLNIARPAYATLFQLNFRFNGFILLAVVGELFGQSELALVAFIMLLIVPVNNVATVLVLTLNLSQGSLSLNTILMRLITNPLIVGCLLGIIGQSLGLNDYPALVTTLDMMGRATLGLTLLAVGAGLTLNLNQYRYRDYLFALPKVTLFPILCYGLGLVFGLSGVHLMILTLFGVTPAAASGYVITRQMGGDAELYANGMSLQVILATILIPLIVVWLPV